MVLAWPVIKSDTVESSEKSKGFEQNTYVRRVNKAFAVYIHIKYPFLFVTAQ